MEEEIKIFKALSDKNRLLILDMLSCGELCACDIIEGLNLTQPTVSHHMKILQESNLVNGVKQGKWTIYSINKDNVKRLTSFIDELTSYKDKCICNRVKSSCDIED
ncbi:winged helix-turn-helix transcriptional regulator [Clostridium sp. D2Q-11]|uniref:Winged helix-turn-helix transcriptional regulator n=1 Tax=Anaeromonas frigoriresistens TaxID=2683708 RepID=A0A942Z6N2_9FIRM|nr:metalloregulator ArsR/SmtB family transcription factor [Anaeromonas frigoriresistens]MBS4538656.1 winged helix-turn-helix transcriptional regulator [Anaeromonas frigoriresistens]